FSSTADPAPISTFNASERMTAPWARSDPSPNRAVPRTTADVATCGALLSAVNTAFEGPSLIAPRWDASRTRTYAPTRPIVTTIATGRERGRATATFDYR